MMLVPNTPITSVEKIAPTTAVRVAHWITRHG
jgi:hypothetical protein